jgi:hypothetical protein
MKKVIRFIISLQSLYVFKFLNRGFLSFGITEDVVITVYLLHFYLQLRLYSKRNMVYGTLYVPELTIPHLTIRRLQHIYMGNPMQESILSPSQGLRI